MDEHIRRIKNLTGTLINPATEDTLSTLSGLSTLVSPETAANVACSQVAASHTLTVGKHNLVIQNTGSKTVYMGGSTVASTTGIVLYPQTAWEFKGCDDGFKIYFICSAGETSTIRVMEF